MKIQMDFCSMLMVVMLVGVNAAAEKDYENKLTKLWSLSSRSDGARTAVVNVTSTSILIQPTPSNIEDQPILKRDLKYEPSEYKQYAFKPRAIPLKREESDRSVHYTNNAKPDILLPGNYFPIADVKRENLNEATYNPLSGGPFQPKEIPLFRNDAFQRRSLDVDEEPIIEKPEGFSDVASRRSWSLLDVAGDTDDDDEDLRGTDSESQEEGKKHIKKKHSKHHGHKYAKYMLPLLLAYKLKFFSLVPVLMGGLVLLVGATGMAGFFFALFAAVMGLQKGSY